MSIIKNCTAPTEHEYAFWRISATRVEMNPCFGKVGGVCEVTLSGFKDKAAWEKGAQPGWNVPLQNGVIPIEKLGDRSEKALEALVIEHVEMFKGGQIDGAAAA